MVKVSITKTGYTVSGHADYDEKGYDIVCSAISALSQSIAMALMLYNDANVFNKNGYMEVDIYKTDDTSEVLLNTLNMGMKEIRREYPEHISVENE